MNTDFYKLFNLSLAKQKGTLTDEMVKENYLNKRKQYFQMIKKCGDKKEKYSIIELKEVLDDDYLKFLDEAYETIETESARKKYDEYIANSKKESKNQDSIKKKDSDINSVNVKTDSQDNKSDISQVTPTNTTSKDLSFVPIYKGNFRKIPPKKDTLTNNKDISENKRKVISKNDHDDIDI